MIVFGSADNGGHAGPVLEDMAKNVSGRPRVGIVEGWWKDGGRIVERLEKFKC